MDLADLYNIIAYNVVYVFTTYGYDFLFICETSIVCRSNARVLKMVGQRK